MKRVKIAVVVGGESLAEFLKNLARAQKISDVVELRVDAIKHFSADDVSVIREKTRKECIFTCRKREEGGAFQGDESSRAAIYKKADEAGFDYLDIEFASRNSLKRVKRAKLIYSFHNFQETPSRQKLEEIARRMKSAKPDIIKIATMVNTEGDIKNLFSLLLQKSDKEKMIVIGMGEKGKITRILSPLLGGHLTYASLEGNFSAPGQIDIHKLKKIIDSLHLEINY